MSRRAGVGRECARRETDRRRVDGATGSVPLDARHLG